METTVQVIVRVRPKSIITVPTTLTTDASQDESTNYPRRNITTGNNSLINTEDSEDNLILSESRISITRDRKGTSEFVFGHVLGPKSTQLDVYNKCSHVINNVINGINCCVMVYGQTSTGKTYSMLGEIDDTLVDSTSFSGHIAYSDANEDLVDYASKRNPGQSEAGLVPRCVEDLFNHLESNAKNKDYYNYSVHAQFLQIYNEKIYDLILDKKKQNPLHLKLAGPGEASSVRVHGISEYRVDKKDDVVALLKKALGNRALRSTDMNSESSRSHSILQLFIRVESSNKQNLVTIKESTFSLVDLAGSERCAVSNSVESLKETSNINTSLYVLGKCVAALTENNRKHIPFRDSQLTRLLQDSLTGVGQTVLITTIHSDERYLEETYNTLQFASRASKIKVSVQPSEVMSEMTVEQARREIRMLRVRLREAEFHSASSTASTTTPRRGVGTDSGTGTNRQGECASCKESMEKLTRLEEENKQLQSHFAQQKEEIQRLQDILRATRSTNATTTTERTQAAVTNSKALDFRIQNQMPSTTPDAAMNTAVASVNRDNFDAIAATTTPIVPKPMSVRSELVSPQRASVCAKHDLSDCVLCNMYITSAPFLSPPTNSGINRQLAAKLTSAYSFGSPSHSLVRSNIPFKSPISSSGFGQSTGVLAMFQSPIPVNGDHSFVGSASSSVSSLGVLDQRACATHRVTNCLLCATRMHTELPILTKLIQDPAIRQNDDFTIGVTSGVPSASMKQNLPKLDLKGRDPGGKIEVLQMLPKNNIDTNTSKEMKASRRYQSTTYYNNEYDFDDAVSELTASQTTILGVVAHNKAHVPLKSLTRRKSLTVTAEGETQHLLAAYLPSIKKPATKKKKKQKSSASNGGLLASFRNSNKSGKQS